MTTSYDIEKASTVWALGDYDRVSRGVIAEFGPELVAACPIGRGARVLDVGAGTGNVALAAAAVGADVVACDPTAELLQIGRERAAEGGLEIEWVQAGAEALPFADGAFDVVTSSVGAIFAPDHAATARELLRVCRPGGTIGMINWPPDGWAAQFFAVLADYAPPTDAPPATLWGDERYIRRLFGDGIAELRATRGRLIRDHFADPAALCSFYRECFGPLIATYAALDDRERRLGLDRDLLAFAERTNRGGTPAVYHVDYLRVIALRA
jgi:2-polyprenyl-6-hydroxyphenyl methylase/3-demethylubiquinone-9 3-methyltransferase